MRIPAILVASALAVAVAAPPASADVQLQIQNGRVTLLAKDATLRQILMEWARVGQTKIVNAERIPGGPLTLELRDVSEQQALKVLLRSVSGYITAPRAALAAQASVFDRIIVMPTIARPPAPSSSAPPPPPFAAFQQPQQPQQPATPDDDRNDGPAQVTPVPGNRGPVFAFPPAGGGQPLPVNPPPQLGRQPGAAVPPPAAAFPGAPTTSAPVGVSTPGMMVPAPQPQPGQPAQPLGPGVQPAPREP